MSDVPSKTTFSAISAIPDDGGARRRPASGGGGGRRRGGGGGDAEPTPGSTSLGTMLMFGVLLAGLLVAGWFIYSQHQLLQSEMAALESARDRLVVLEDRLEVTHETLSETGQKSSEQLSFWESETRKLWAVVNERNLNMIKENAAAIARLEKSMTTLDGTVREIRASVGRHESAFARQEQMVDQITNLDVQLQQVQRAMRDVVDSNNAAQQSVSALNTGLSRRVTENEEAVKAFDAYRLQVNSRIADLERRLSAPPQF